MDSGASSVTFGGEVEDASSGSVDDLVDSKGAPSRESRAGVAGLQSEGQSSKTTGGLTYERRAVVGPARTDEGRIKRRKDESYALSATAASISLTGAEVASSAARPRYSTVAREVSVRLKSASPDGTRLRGPAALPNVTADSPLLASGANLADTRVEGGEDRTKSTPSQAQQGRDHTAAQDESQVSAQGVPLQQSLPRRGGQESRGRHKSGKPGDVKGPNALELRLRALGQERRQTSGRSSGASTHNWHEPNCTCAVEVTSVELLQRALHRWLGASVKGFLIGAGLKGGLVLFSSLAKLAKQLREKGRRAAVSSTSHFPRQGLRETWRYGLFLSAYAGIYTALDELIGAAGGHQGTGRWRALVAGAVAGPSLLLTGHDKRHTSMAIYIALRAAVLCARCGIKSRRVGPLFRPLTWQHGDVFLMCLSSLQILWAYLLHPSSLPPSYVSFLNKHVGKPGAVVRKISAFASPARPVNGGLRDCERAWAEWGVDARLDPTMRIPCELLHPPQHCATHLLTFLPQAYARALNVYIPVYLVPALLVHRQALLKRPLDILGRAALGTARSSFFLASYVSSAWLYTCVIHQSLQSCSAVTLAAGMCPAGLAVLFEKKSRRMELALYCLSRAIESFGVCLHDWGYLRGLYIPGRLDVVMFSASTAVIMYCYAQQRDVFRTKYLNVLDWVFGLPGFIHGCGTANCPMTPRQPHQLLPRPLPPSPLKPHA